MVNKNDLIEGFKKIGLKPGMNIMVHSSLSKFGHVDGGADTVIDALMEVISEEGTLLFPTFNHDACYKKGELFDVRTTPSTNGIIPNTFLSRDGVIRSNSPTHAFAAWGKNKEKYILNHENVDTMGIGSPLDLLMKDDGYCLLLGVNYHANTFHHCVEMLENAHCIGKKTELYPMITRDGEKKEIYNWGWRERKCPINDDALYSSKMSSIDSQVKIGEATVTLYKLSEGYKIIAQTMKQGIDGFPSCQNCPIMPRVSTYTIKK